MSDGIDRQVMGGTIALAAKVKALLEGGGDLHVDTSYGDRFYVSEVVLKAAGDWGSEIVGYLVPDEADGKTFDLWTHRDPGDRPTAAT
jgi:hypothetical protein